METFYYLDDKQLVFEASIPGLNPKDFPVSYSNYTGKQELSIGPKIWSISDVYDLSKAVAKYEFGVIKVTVPRAKVTANQIVVQGV